MKRASVPTDPKDRAGKSVEYRVWYVEFRDHLETIRRLTAFGDRKQSESFGRNLETLVADKINGDAPDKQLSRWIESLPKYRLPWPASRWATCGKAHGKQRFNACFTGGK